MTLTNNNILKKIIIGISIPIVLAALSFVVSLAYSQINMNLETSILAKANADGIDKLKNLPDQIGKLQNSINDLYKEITTIQGIAKVGAFGKDEGYIQINTAGKALRYLKYKRAVVTNLSNVAHPSYPLLIRGTFHDSNSECIIRVSEKAAKDMFEVNNGDFKVQIELIELE